MNSKNLKDQRKKFLLMILKQMGIEVRDEDFIFIKKNDLIFKIYFWGNTANVYFIDCYDCELDCIKETYFEFNKLKNIQIILNDKDEIEIQSDPGKKNYSNIECLTRDDLHRLSMVYTLVEESRDLDFTEVKEQLKYQLSKIKFLIIGFDYNEIYELIDKIKGENIEISFLKDCKCKMIETFPQLTIELCSFSKDKTEDLLSNRPAPILLEFIKDIFGFLIFSNSTSEDITKIKNNILPVLYKYNPFALCVVFGFNYGEPNHLPVELMKKVLNRTVYGIPNEEKIDAFMEILYKTVLLRLDQMKEASCPFIEE